MTALLLALALASSLPPLGCALTVGESQYAGQIHITGDGYEAQALGYRGYSLTHGQQTIKTWTSVRPLLASLTWRRPSAKPATMMCTQKKAEVRKAKREHVAVLCAWGDELLFGGHNMLKFDAGGATWEVTANGFEMRIERDTPELGYIGTWADHLEETGNTLSIQVGQGPILTCWRT